MREATITHPWYAYAAWTSPAQACGSCDRSPSPAASPQQPPGSATPSRRSHARPPPRTKRGHRPVRTPPRRSAAHPRGSDPAAPRSHDPGLPHSRRARPHRHRRADRTGAARSVPERGRGHPAPSLARLAATDPQVTVTTTEGTTPTLIRALRAGSIDLAVLTSRPPHRPLDGESPRLHIETVADTELVVAVPSTGEFAGRTAAHVDELVDAPWIATPASNSEPLLGVWPGLPGRPHIVHCARDWLTKLQLVAGGFGVTTVPSRLSPMLPPGVSLLHIEGAPPEIRRVLVARLPGRPTPAITAVTRAITSTA